MYGHGWSYGLGVCEESRVSEGGRDGAVGLGDVHCEKVSSILSTDVRPPAKAIPLTLGLIVVVAVVPLIGRPTADAWQSIGRALEPTLHR